MLSTSILKGQPYLDAWMEYEEKIMEAAENAMDNAEIVCAALLPFLHQLEEEPDFVLSREPDEITSTALESSRQVETGFLEEPDFVRDRVASETTKSASEPSRQVETGFLEEGLEKVNLQMEKDVYTLFSEIGTTHRLLDKEGKKGKVPELSLFTAEGEEALYELIASPSGEEPDWNFFLRKSSLSSGEEMKRLPLLVDPWDVLELRKSLLGEDPSEEGLFEERPSEEDLSEEDLSEEDFSEENAFTSLIREKVEELSFAAEEELSLKEKRASEFLWQAEKDRVRLGLDKSCFRICTTCFLAFENPLKSWLMSNIPFVCAEVGEDFLYGWYLCRSEEGGWEEVKLKLCRQKNEVFSVWEGEEWKEVDGEDFAEMDWAFEDNSTFVEILEEMKDYFETAMECSGPKSSSLSEIFEDSKAALEKESCVLESVCFYDQNILSFLNSSLIGLSLSQPLPIYKLGFSDDSWATVSLLMDEENEGENDWYYFALVKKEESSLEQDSDYIQLPFVYLGE